MDWFRPIDAYCERTDASYWSEPINALTNLAFILGAVLLWRLAKSDWRTGFLTVLLALIGVGSYLFHTHANPWSGLLDVVFIMLFLNAYLLFMLRYGLSLSWWKAALGVLLFIGINMLVGKLGGRAFNGSIGYAPALVTLLAVGVYFRIKKHAIGSKLLLAAGLFFCSLVARTVDDVLCEFIPIGTHFLWHIFNAWVIYVLIHAFHHNVLATTNN